VRGRRSPIVISLRDQQREELEYFVRCPNKPAGLVRRARAVLILAQGGTFCDVQQQTGLQRRHARKWAKRFVWRGVEGLNDGKRPGRKPVFSPLGGNPTGEGGVRTARPGWTVAEPVGLPRTRQAVGA
jgi:hypothetical protein